MTIPVQYFNSLFMSIYANFMPKRICNILINMGFTPRPPFLNNAKKVQKTLT